MATTEIHGSRQIRDDTITNAEIKSDAAIALSKLAEAVIQADGGQAFTGNQSLGSNKITSLGDGTADTDAATWGQVKSFVNGKDYKDSVRAATTVTGALATAYENGDAIDGVTLATGDRILIKNQSTASENGIYTVNASGSPTRATDADTSADVTAGLTVRVTEGSTQADTEWTLTTNDPITLGTTGLTFADTSPPGGGFTTAGAGLTSSGVTVDAVAADASIIVNANDFAVQKDDASLEVGAGGLRVKQGTSGQVYIASAGGVLTPVTLSGDATVTAAGVLTLAGTVVKEADFVDMEVPGGAINGSNTAFTLANTPIAGSVHLYMNGILQRVGGSNDYTISGLDITYNTAPATGDVLLASYRK